MLIEWQNNVHIFKTKQNLPTDLFIYTQTCASFAKNIRSNNMPCARLRGTPL